MTDTLRSDMANLHSNQSGWLKLGKPRAGVAAVAVGAGAVAAGAVASSVVKKQGADKAARTMREGLAGYERIDLNELQQNAIATARQNAANSIALEKELTPDIARTRSTLSNQVANELELGGKLSPDVVNQVTAAAQGQANSAGLYGGGGPITAAMLGLTAMDVANQRKANAAALLAANPMQQVGLSPEALAAISVQDTTNLNQAKLATAGVQANLQMTNAANIGDNITGATSTIGGAMMGGKGNVGSFFSGAKK